MKKLRFVGRGAVIGVVVGVGFFFLAAIPVVSSDRADAADTATELDTEALDELDQLAQSAVSSDPKVAVQARDALRAGGRDGLERLFTVHEEFANNPQSGEMIDDAAFNRWREAVEVVSRQKDGHLSRLYWHTNLDQAMATAERENKMILSLRLLGNLDDELSCANSRFFRTVLYADPTVSRVLRERFVLHWEPVRPVPKITVELGDGRRIERTITGNSLHLVLDSRGRVISAIPGLTAPQSFIGELTYLTRSSFWLSYEGESASPPYQLIHQGNLNRLAERWYELSTDATDVATTTAAHDPPESNTPHGIPNLINNPGDEQVIPAVRAAATPRGKFPTERMLLAQLERPNVTWSEPNLDDPEWSRVIGRIRSQTDLSDTTRMLMAQHRFGDTFDPHDPVQRAILNEVVDTFTQALAEDTAINLFSIQRQIHVWLLAEGPPTDTQQFIDRVYAELFESPLDDPWMGLVADHVYTALPMEGLVDPY